MIVLNIDGVVANLADELIYQLRNKGYDIDPIEKWEDYHWKNIFPHVPENIVNEVMVDPLTIKNARPFEKAWYWINHLASEHDMMFLTARDPVVTQETWGWFFDWDIPVDFVVFEKNKVDFLQQIKPYLYVDDYPDMAQGAFDVGIDAYLMNQPYNQAADVTVPRIDSLWDITINV